MAAGDYVPTPLPAEAQAQVATVCASATTRQEAVDAIRAWMNDQGVSYSSFDWSCVAPYMPADWAPSAD